MTEDEATAEAQRFYIDNLLYPYDPRATVYTSTPDPDVVAGGYRIEVWSESNVERVRLFVSFDGTVREEDSA